MSYQYDQYLMRHKENVKRGYDWFCENLPEIVEGGFDMKLDARMADHDLSKSDKEEYDAYDAYFYGGNRSYAVVQDFNKAWLHHIHKNPHHWQHWVLINDDADEGTICIEMPKRDIIEMICDWWSFSWSKDNFEGIFDWWNSHKDHIKLHDNTRKIVIDILGKMAEKLGYEESSDDQRLCYEKEGG